MKIIVTSDLHNGITRMSEIQRFAKIANEYDLLIIAGDIAASKKLFEEVLSCFTVKIAFTTGNHDLYTTIENDSIMKYVNDFSDYPNAHFLDDKPLKFKDFAIVGIMGWYDHSFKDKSLERYGVNDKNYLTQKFSYGDGGIQWNDYNYIKWSAYTAETFTKFQLKRMKEHLDKVKKFETVIFVSHFLPYRELLDNKEYYEKIINELNTETIPEDLLYNIRRVSEPTWSFGNAFQGSEKMGELLDKYDNVKYVFCGHSHIKKSITHNNKKVELIGTEYGNIDYEVIEI